MMRLEGAVTIRVKGGRELLRMVLGVGSMIVVQWELE